MSQASRHLGVGLLLVSLVAAGFVPCACSGMVGAAGHGHCAAAPAGVRAAERGCDCPCMKGYEAPQTMGPTAVKYTPAPVVVQLAPAFDIARACVSEPPRSPVRFSSSPPLGPPLVLRI